MSETSGVTKEMMDDIRAAKEAQARRWEQENQAKAMAAVDPAPKYRTAVLNERETTHGDYRDTARIAQRLKDAVRREASFDALDDTAKESLDLICTKVARILSGNSRNIDHWRDVSAYAGLIAERLGRQDGAFDAKSVKVMRVNGEWVDA
jgi:hypothetical protein